jgi:hypothetical protein
MSNYVFAAKKFVSHGYATIELADITIDKISVNINNEKVDRTNFLKYGYNNSHSREICEYNEKNIDTSISIENNEYYFNYIDTDISVGRKIILSNLGDMNKDMIYCIVKKIINDKIYINYYTETSIVTKKYDNIKLIKYNDIKEINNSSEFIINGGGSLITVTLPIFLPIITLNNSLTKQIIIHIKNNIEKCDIIFLPKENNLIDSLTKNSFYVISHNNSNNNNDFSTYIVSFFYNGYNSWFVI